MKISESLCKLLNNLGDYLERCKREKEQHLPIVNFVFGYNGYSFDYNFIEQKFANLSRFWDVVALEDAKFFGKNCDVVGYRFRVYQPKNNCAGTQQLERACGEIAQVVLMKHLRECGRYFNSVESFVTVKKSVNVLMVFFALTPCGVHMVAEAKKRTFE